MEFSFRLAGAGWAGTRVTHTHGAVSLRASYVSDALGDLLAAVEQLLEGPAAARCSWSAEPVESRWLFERQGALVQLRILRFADAERPEPDDRGTLVYETRESLPALATSIADDARDVLELYGAKGHATEWGGAPFPSDRLARIRELTALLR